MHFVGSYYICLSQCTVQKHKKGKELWPLSHGMKRRENKDWSPEPPPQNGGGELNVYVYRHSCINEGSHFVSLVRWVVLGPYFLLLFVVRAKRLIDTRAHTQTRDGAAKYSRPAPPSLLSFLILNDSLSSCVQFLGPFAKSRKWRMPSSCQPVRLFAYILSASARRICTKFCIEDVY